MEIERKEENEKITLCLKGRLDTVNSPILEKALKGEFENIKDLVLDLKGLEYVSSSGLRLFLIGYKTQKSKNKSFTLANATSSVSEVLDMTGLSSLLEEK